VGRKDGANNPVVSCTFGDFATHLVTADVIYRIVFSFTPRLDGRNLRRQRASFRGSILISKPGATLCLSHYDVIFDCRTG